MQQSVKTILTGLNSNTDTTEHINEDDVTHLEQFEETKILNDYDTNSLDENSFFEYHYNEPKEHVCKEQVYRYDFDSPEKVSKTRSLIFDNIQFLKENTGWIGTKLQKLFLCSW